MFDEVAEKGKGAKLREQYMQESLSQILRVITTEERLSEFHLDAIARVPHLAGKLGLHLSGNAQVKALVVEHPLLLVAAAISKPDQWIEEAARRLSDQPEALFHLLSAIESKKLKVDPAPLLRCIRRFPFWAMRLIRVVPRWQLELLPDDTADDSNPYALIHHFLTHPADDCSRGWVTILQHPITAVLAVRWLGARGLPWDLLPVSVLGPREAYNVLALWPDDRSPPVELWQQMVEDPEWLIAAWRIPGAHAPKGAAAEALHDRICKRHANRYVYGDPLRTWWRRNAAPAPAGSGRPGGHAPELDPTA